MFTYEVNSDGTIARDVAPVPSSSNNLIENNEPTRVYLGDGNSAATRAYFDPLIFFSILIPIVTFIIGQVIQYVGYVNDGEVFVANLIFKQPELWHLLVATGIGIIGVVFTILSAIMFLGDDLVGWFWVYIILTGLLFAVVPALAVSICAVSSLIIFLSYRFGVEESISWKIPLALIGLAIFFVLSANSVKMTGGAELIKVSSFSEIFQYTDSEIVAIDISRLDEDDDLGYIETGSNCRELVLVGGIMKSYYDLKIVTSATKVTLKNVKIYDGYLRIKSERCTLTVSGINSIEGINGSSGIGGLHENSDQKDGKHGTPPLSAQELIFTGWGRLSLTAGNGGRGGYGASGGSGGIFSNGYDGSDGGDGGDSSVVIDCIRMSSDRFNGKLVLTLGVPGSGGAGGSGGKGGIFGHSGDSGDQGSHGVQNTYTNGENLIDDKHIKYNDLEN
ncbi:MAG: hypothetical protein J6V80_01625 [Clostridia bacterium]|nr:hypothetical protein [Clostridia bacterium]